MALGVTWDSNASGLGFNLVDAMVTGFAYQSLRAKQARLGARLGGKMTKFGLNLLLLGFLGSGLALLWYKIPLGWLMLAVSLWLGSLLIWQKWQLEVLAVNKNTQEFSELLSKDVLALLGPEVGLRQLADLLFKTNSAAFVATRYGILAPTLDLMVADLLEEASINGQADLANGMAKIMAEIETLALKVRQDTQSEQISGGVLVIALIQRARNHEEVLNKLKLSLSDLYDGLRWFNYLHGQVKDAKKPKHRGGIARDLMFGYTPLLTRFGQNISLMRGRATETQILQESHADAVEKTIAVLSGGGRQNVAIVGPEGSGRSTIVYALIDKLSDADSKVPSSLHFRQVFRLDATALIAAAGGVPGGLERLMTQILNETFLAKNIILWLDQAQLFFSDTEGAVNIANVLMPVLEGGRLRIIMTMDEQKFLEVSSKNTQLTNVLNKIMVSAADEQETMKIMQDRVPFLEYQNKVFYTFLALKEAYKLGERYVHEMVMPGKAINLLEAAANYADARKVVDERAVQEAVEKSYGVKLAASTGQEKARLLSLEDLIHERMIDQKEAVAAVSNALRRAAAGVRNTNRPIGTFLFLGPTGVGKTELAKAIAAVYFQGEGEMIRVDLNQFVDEAAVMRLIEDGAKNEASLTAQVMKKPFAVVLLDEIEKAHPKVLTTLLQMLDEGILRDEKNREVSFRDTIVVATSNAGAQAIREWVAKGAQGEFKQALINYLINSGEFKPEFINRFDEVCIFRPLDKTALTEIARLIIAGVNKTLATQKISVEVDEQALALLVQRGYDPQLGARPMRRAVQETVENLVARRVLENKVSAGDKVVISAADLEQH